MCGIHLREKRSENPVDPSGFVQELPCRLGRLDREVKDALLKGEISPDERDQFEKFDRIYGPSIYTVP